MKTILIVAAGPLQLPLFAEAGRQGLRIVAVDGNPSAPGLALAASGHVLPLHDYAGIRRIAEAEKIDAVSSLCTDFAVRTAAHVAEQLGLPGPAFSAACDATDKRRMRRRFLSAGAPSIPFREVADPGAALQAARDFGYPVALKAPRSAGSRGVFRVGSDDELRAFFPQARLQEPRGRLLVESWIDGPEVSVEGCCAGGRIHVVQITDKLLYPGPSPVEAGHTQGSRLPAPVQQAIRDCAVAGIRALHLDHCGFHAEIKIGPAGPRIIEIAARLGGDRIATDLTPLSTGVDLVRAVLDIALGGTPDVAPGWTRGAAIRYFDARRSGTLSGVRGLDVIPAMPGFERLAAGPDHGPPLEPGFPAPVIRSSLDRYGYVIFSGDNACQAAARAERAAALEFEFAA